MTSEKQLKHISKLTKLNKDRYVNEGHHRIGCKHSKETKEKISSALKNSNNGSWKGDKVGRISIHDYIRRRKPKPLLCEFCKKIPPRVLAKKQNEKYDRDINHYFWLCDKCHFRYDDIPHKISIAKIGKPNLATKGIAKSEEHKRKISETKKRLFKEEKLKVWNKHD